MKRCYRCKEVKPPTKFYKDKTGTNGLSDKCKNCAAIYYREKRKRHRESYKEKDRRYYQRHKKEILLKRQEWYRKNKHKRNAHEAVQKALYEGTIKRIDICEGCMSEPSVHAHHEDYNEPLKVIWLCRSCHMLKHQSLLSPDISL